MDFLRTREPALSLPRIRREGNIWHWLWGWFFSFQLRPTKDTLKLADEVFDGNCTVSEVCQQLRQLSFRGGGGQFVG